MGRAGVLSRIHASHEADKESVSQTADSISMGSTHLQGADPACMEILPPIILPTILLSR